MGRRNTWSKFLCRASIAKSRSRALIESPTTNCVETLRSVLIIKTRLKSLKTKFRSFENRWGETRTETI